ncbi:MAG: hypothetical protein K0Q49_2448 [Haloplasmataceae bacterium]|nr:hypothetical protein [Haloplasmataceae bacterium]
MSSNVKITYVNRSMNKDLPKVFIFTKNEVPNFDSLKDGVAWKVIPNIGRESSCQFIFPIETEVCASWDNGTCTTKKLISEIGDKYTIEQDDTGIIIAKDGNASDIKSIDVVNNLHIDNGIAVQLYKDGRMMMTKNIVGYDQKATFVLHPKLYWGIASEIQEGDMISSAVLNSESFFEQDLEGVSNVTMGLYGNAKDGYQFKVESQS